MPDTYDATFKTQKVFHDGTSMIVAKEGETHPVSSLLVGRFVDEGAIDAPDGWEADIAYKNSLARADGSGTVPPTDGSGTFDHDGDGKAGGSLSDNPPALTGKSKAQLLDIAADEGVEVEDGSTNAEIVSAIEAGRSGDEAPA